MTRWLCALAVAAAGCSSAPAGPVSLTAAEYDPLTLLLTDLGDGATLHLQAPPQGGQVVFVGARVRGLVERTVELEASLRAADGSTLGEDQRATDFAPSADDASVFIPDLRSYAGVANVALCPSASATSVDGLAATLEVTVTESQSRRAGSASLSVVPRCTQSDATVLALCRCECAPGFTAGSCP